MCPSTSSGGGAHADKNSYSNNNNWTISKISYADYGLATPDTERGCAFDTADGCHSDQLAHVAAACLGKNSCSFHVSNTFAGVDPCPGINQKHLSVVAECSGSGTLPPPPPPAPGVSRVHLADPVVDLYFFAGPTHHDVLYQYTQLTGRMSMPPKWAMGLWYHPKETSNQTRVLEIVKEFGVAGVPLAAVTLEPPWQTHAYSCSYVWNPAHFWDVPSFVKQLNDVQGVQLTLWEHAYVYNASGAASPLYRAGFLFCLFFFPSSEGFGKVLLILTQTVFHTHRYMQMHMHSHSHMRRHIHTHTHTDNCAQLNN